MMDGCMGFLLDDYITGLFIKRRDGSSYETSALSNLLLFLFLFLLFSLLLLSLSALRGLTLLFL